jgi:hypothetical protein
MGRESKEEEKDMDEQNNVIITIFNIIKISDMSKYLAILAVLFLACLAR